MNQSNTEIAPLPRPWYAEARQWLGIAAAVAALVLSAVLVRQWRTVLQLQEREALSAAASAEAQRQREQLRENVRETQELLEHYQGQREQLVREIAEFQVQLALLSERSEGLERARDRLEVLDIAFGRFRAEEERFNTNLDRLSGSIDAAGGGGTTAVDAPL